MIVGSQAFFDLVVELIQGPPFAYGYAVDMVGSSIFPSPRYGELRTSLENRGTPIGLNAMLIAAHALALDCIVITANEREFSRPQTMLNPMSELASVITR